MERAELARRLGAARMAPEPHDVVVGEREPARFRAALAGAVAAGGTVFLANPDWGTAERTQFDALVATSAQRSTLNLEPSTSKCRVRAESGSTARAGDGAGPDWQSKFQIPNSKFDFGWLCIPTGGSSGRLKLARHDQDTLHPAVRGFAAHFGVTRLNAVGVLPLHHVGGLMGWLRCALTGGEFLDLEWKTLEAGKMPALPMKEEGWFLSLVPTQLHRLLARPAMVAWLREFRAVLVGGGALWPELAEAAAKAGVPLAPTYGATETAAAAAALRPAEFLAGRRGCGTALPHARVTVAVDGSIRVESESLFRGYWPDWREPGVWPTGDRGGLDEHDGLQVLGRSDALIVTGGEKVDPAEVEAALRASGEFDDVAVLGVPDPEWGSAVVACYPAGGRSPDSARLAAALTPLAAHKHPKRWVALTGWPRNAAGKLDRGELARRANAVSGGMDGSPGRDRSATGRDHIFPP
jgi:O-succinylbenzoic acid--CoA ligase